MKKFLVLMGALLLLPAVLFAADFRTDTVAKGENVKNLYLAGQNPAVNADVKGDLVVAGSDVQVNGSVEHSLLAAGGTVRVKGNVGQNLRVAGGNLTFDGKVGEDTTVAGGSVSFSNTSVVNGDVMVAGGNVDLSGTVNGSVYITGGTVTIRGKINGNVKGNNVGDLRVESGAVIGGKLDYSSPRQATISGDAKVGSVNYTKITQNERASAAKIFSTAIVFKEIMSLLALLLLVYLFPRASAELTENAFRNPLLNLLIGFVTLIVAPALIILLLITVFGMAIAGLVALAYFLILALAALYSILLVGSATWKIIQKDDVYRVGWEAVLVGILISLVLSFIPVIGWLVMFLFFLIALGSFLTRGWDQMKLQRAEVKK